MTSIKIPQRGFSSKEFETRVERARQNGRPYMSQIFSGLKTALSLGAIMLRVPQRPSMVNKCRLRIASCGSYEQLRYPRLLLRLNAML